MIKTLQEPANNPGQKYRAMWASALNQAIDDLEVRVFPKMKEKVVQELERHQHLAYNWFNSESNSIGSFVWTCEVLDVSPKMIRQIIRDKQLKRVTRINC